MSIEKAIFRMHNIYHIYLCMHIYSVLGDAFNASVRQHLSLEMLWTKRLIDPLEEENSLFSRTQHALDTWL